MFMPAVFTAAVLSLPAQPAPVDLHPRLAVDDALDYRLRQTTEFAWEELAADGPEPARRSARVEFDARLRLIVLGTSADGAAVVSAVFESLKLKQSIDGGPLLGTSISGSGLLRDGDQPAPGASVEAAPEGTPLQNVAGALASAVIRFDLAPDGSVTMLTGLDRAWEIGGQHPREGERLLGPFAPAAAKLTLAALMRIDPSLPGTPRRTGESWPILERLGGPRFGTMVHQTIWTLGSVEGSTATLSGRTDFALKPPESRDPASPVVTLKETSGVSSATWDTAAGRLIRREDRRSVTVETVLAGVETRRASATTATSARTIEKSDAPTDR